MALTREGLFANIATGGHGARHWSRTSEAILPAIGDRARQKGWLGFHPRVSDVPLNSGDSGVFTGRRCSGHRRH